MAFDQDNISLLADGVMGASTRIFGYRSEVDTQSQILADGYFSDVRAFRFSPGDIVLVNCLRDDGVSQFGFSAVVDRVTEGGVATITADGNPISFEYPTVAALQAARIPAVISRVRTLGFSSANDGGGADLARYTGGETAGVWTSGDGAKWRLIIADGAHVFNGTTFAP